jgi:predicted nuclease of predicted toxin-antitoxin system
LKILTKSGGKARRPYLNQKIDLYFDENFPREVIADLKRDKGWKRKCRFYSVYDFGNENKDDTFQFGFCKGKGFTLVTLDDDFFNDTLYPFNGFPGIIKIVTNETTSIAFGTAWMSCYCF